MRPIKSYINIRRNVRPHAIVEKDMHKDDFVKYLLSMGFHATTTKKGFTKNKSEYMFGFNGNIDIHKADDDVTTSYHAIFNEWNYKLSGILITTCIDGKTKRARIGFDEFMIEMETK